MKYCQGKMAKSYNVSINQKIAHTIKWMSCVSKSMHDYYVVGDLSTLQITAHLGILHPLGKLKLRMASTHPMNLITSQSKHYVRKELDFH